ncbi:DUF3060 domain-containing protein, partial [Methylorubrum sp. Q1]|uniref:DUF3060 domain-containing protein n=1 Tax=Methylorubrum sp. Q1 TaxID=2562453 RepID=UPI0010763FFB
WGSTSINLGGEGTHAVVNGQDNAGGYVGMVSSNQSLTLNNSGFRIGTADNLQDLTITSNNAIINLGINNKVKIIGSGNTVSAGQNAHVTVDGTDNKIDTLDFNSQVFMNGFSNTTNLNNTFNVHYYYSTQYSPLNYYDIDFMSAHHGGGMAYSGYWHPSHTYSPAYSPGGTDVGIFLEDSGGRIIFPTDYNNNDSGNYLN